MSAENKLLHRAAVAERDKTKKKEVEALNESLRERALNQLKAHGKDVTDNRFRENDAVKYKFSDFVKIELGEESVRVNFELGANDVHPDNATGISIAVPILGEMLLIEKQKASDRGIGNYSEAQDEPARGQIVTKIPKSKTSFEVLKVQASYNQLEQYAGLLNLIDEKFPPQPTAGKPAEAVAPNTP